MSIKKYDTAPAINTTGGSSTGAVIWQMGEMEPNPQDVWIHYGNSQYWERDVNFAVDNLKSNISESSSVRIGANNGRDHEENYAQRDAVAKWPLMKYITGFSINFQQDSTAGHGLYLRNAGIEWVNAQGTFLRWGSNDRSRHGDYDEHTAVYRFSASDRLVMSETGSRFYKFICRISSRGGTGTRTTNVKLGSFRLLYEDTGCDNGRWVLPTERSFGSRHSEDIIIKS